MPFMYDPYDPEELRRRQALGDAAMSEDDGGASEILNDGPDDEPDGDVDDQTPQANQPGMLSSPTADKYRETLNNMPQREDYQPSKLRRFGAALAGGLAGARDAKTGMAVASSIRDQRYNDAQQDWAGNVNRSAIEMGLDKDLAAQDVARRRAGAAEESAHARTRAAAATESWRRSQEAHQPWQPTTEEQAINFKKAGLTQPRPTAFQEYLKDPEGYSKYLKDVNAGKTQPLTFEQRKQLQDNATQGRLKVVGAQIAGRAANQKASKPIMASPADQLRAEQMAMEQVARTDPSYGQFIVRGGPKVPPRLMTAAELPKEGGDQWYKFGMGSPAHTPAITELKHKEFLSEVEKAKRRILGTQKVPNTQEDPDGSAWDMEFDDDEGEQ